MANDIIFLRCRYCGAGLPLAKYYPSGNLGDLHRVTWDHGDEVPLGNLLADFLAWHLQERDNARWKTGIDLEAEPGIEWVTEDPNSSTGQMYLGDERRPYWARAFPPTPLEQQQALDDA